MKNFHRDLVTLCWLQNSATSYACACLRWGHQARPLPAQRIWSCSGSIVAKRRNDHEQGAIIADLWVFFCFLCPLGFERGRWKPTKWVLHLMPKNSMQQSILLPSSKFGITPPVVNIGAWQCACSLCWQQAMVPVFDRKWPCAQQSFGVPVTEGDFALVAEIRDRYVALETVHHNHSLSVGLWHLLNFLWSQFAWKVGACNFISTIHPFGPRKTGAG